MAEPVFFVSEDFARTILELHEQAGAQWLKQLPTLLADYVELWSLTIGLPFAPLSYNYVAPVVRADGTQAVLKLGVPECASVAEIEALRLFDGNGIVRLLNADSKRGALLLERLEPGTPLATLCHAGEDEQATSIAVTVMSQLWCPAPKEHPFPSVADWVAGIGELQNRFGGGSGPLPAVLVAQAQGLCGELLASMDEPVLLHGDLHHYNILAAERSPWLAIDPKGVVGEPAYDVGAMLRNPMPQLLTMPQPRRILERRVEQLAEELGFNRARLRSWGLVQAVLAACWSLEDHGQGWEPWIACAEHLSAIKVS